MSKVHDFNTDLAYSEKASEEPFWQAVYRKAFPDLACFMANDHDNIAQRRGVDRVLLLNNQRVVYIDEKKRREVYQDILLEYISNDRTKAPGWINKDLAIDYLAYAFMPTYRCYLLDWLMLRRAWLRFGDDWKRRYPNIEAKNKSYSTWSVAVPITILCKVIQQATVIDVSEELSIST